MNLPLCASFSSSGEELVVAYAFNNMVVCYDVVGRYLHQWSQMNKQDAFPKAFTKRYNRIVGIVEAQEGKFIVYTHYTWFLLDLSINIPDEAIVDSGHAKHSFKKKDKALDANATWFNCLRSSQHKYIKTMLHGHQLHKFNDQMIEKSGEEGAGNLELHKNDEPILHMHVSEDDAQDLFVIENPWKNAVEQFPGVAQIRSKFGM